MRSGLIATTVAAMCVLMAGCGGGDAPPIVASFDSSPTKIFAGPSGVGKSLQQQATDSSTAVVSEYYALMGRLLTSSKGSVDELKSVAMDPDTTKMFDGLSSSALAGSPVLSDATDEVTAARAARWKGSGQESVTNTAVTNWAAPADSSGVPTSGTAFVEIRVCVDSSDFKPLLPNGKPAYDSNRRPLRLQKFLVLNPAWPDKNGWRLATQSVKGETPCTAA